MSVTRPELTMPEAEADALRLAYHSARVILEYGSGGSTVLASEMPGKQIYSVESDADWAAMMRGWFAENPGTSPVEVIHADIGPTKEWGHPKGSHGWRGYPAYSLGVWDRKGFRQPEVVLVDGRFRVGCALATAFRTKRKVTLLFDDYVQRDHYHVIEEFLGQPEVIGRMAIFEVNPQPVDPNRLLRIVELICAP